jgi:hypothetical protein
MPPAGKPQAEICYGFGQRTTLHIHQIVEYVTPVIGIPNHLPDIWQKVFPASVNRTHLAIRSNSDINSPSIKSHLPHLRADDPTFVDRQVWSVNGKPMVALFTVKGGGLNS